MGIWWKVESENNDEEKDAECDAIECIISILDNVVMGYNGFCVNHVVSGITQSVFPRHLTRHLNNWMK